ncbi:MAG: hypothetical protein P8Y49_03940 [Sulfurovaceae bacterium]
MITKSQIGIQKTALSFSHIALFFVLLDLIFIMSIAKNIGLLILLLLTLFSFVKYQKIKISKIFYVVAIGYGLILVYSYGNPVIHFEFKYHASFFLVFILMFQIMREKEYSLEIFFKYSYILSTIVFILYIALFLNFLPNPYRDEDRPLYAAFRVSGPSLGIFLFPPFLYVMSNFPKTNYYQNRLYISFVLGLVACALSGSNQSFVLHVLFYAFAILKPSMKNIAIIVLVSLMSIFLAPKLLSEAHLEKLSQIINPLESRTAMTRLNDLSYAYDQMIIKDENIIFGEGIGISTEILRTSLDGKWSEYRKFLEIDNGFFYVFHRLGIVGLIVYIGVIFYLLYRFGSRRNKLMYFSFFLVTNLLSTHFFTHIFSAFLTYLLTRRLT